MDDLNQDAFVKSQEDSVVVVTIMWGLKEQDRSECHHTDYKCKGKTVLDRSFDMNPPPCQEAMKVSHCKHGTVYRYYSIGLWFVFTQWSDLVKN